MDLENESLYLDDSAFSNDYMLSLPKVRRDIIEDCMVALGYPVITLFITQRQINRLIDFSVRRCEGKACQTFLETFYVWGGCIDVSAYNMEAVKYIYRADLGSGGTNSSGNCACGCSSCKYGGSSGSINSNPLSGCDICNKLCKYRMYSWGLTGTGQMSRLYDNLSLLYVQSELDNLELNDWYLDSTEGKLYLDGFSGWITVEYVKSSVTMEDLADNSYWKSWIRDYTLAMVKITEGRIRGKYKISSGVFDIEADELVSEGNSDKDTLDQSLNDDIGYWNILR